MKPKHIIVSIFTSVAIILLIATLVSSCSIRKVSKSINKSLSDSSGSIYKDTFTTKKTNVKKTEKKDSTTTKESVDSSDTEVTFYDNDSTEPTGPIIIKKDSGKITIDPGGRKVKSLKTKESKTKKEKVNKSTQSESHISTQDSSGKKEETKTSLKKKTENIQVNKNAKNFFTFWWLWLIIIVIVFIYLKSKLKF